MKSILLAHVARYPLTEPRDAVKLIYQNEFGGGHMISDADACMNYLQKEYDSIPQDPAYPLLEDIGNGIFRVHLAALENHRLSVRELGDSFIRSANLHTGTVGGFRRKLDVLSDLTHSGQMPFSADALMRYLADYEKAGFPPVSHSETFRNTYHPAYRVVRADCLPSSILQQMP